MPTKPVAPKVPGASTGSEVIQPRADAPAKVEAAAKKETAKLTDGQEIRVSLNTPYPLWCHTQNKRIYPGDEPKMAVDKWIRANVERGNLSIIV